MNAAVTLEESAALLAPLPEVLFDAIQMPPPMVYQSLAGRLGQAAWTAARAYAKAKESGESFSQGGPAWDAHDAAWDAFNALVLEVKS